MAASATLALNAGAWCRRARLLIVSPDSRDNLARRQAETPLSALCRFPEPALAAYAGRTRHYHVKVQKPGGRILTTQLYFPDEPLNSRDSLFDRRLVLRLGDSDDGRLGRFDFVV